jgi:hypothetical protein
MKSILSHSKTTQIPQQVLEQFQYESNSFKRRLAFMVEENIHLKNRLSEIVKVDFNKYLLEKLENFQNNFLTQDDRIALLRHDVTQLQKVLFSVNEILPKEIDNSVKTLRNNIATAEMQFRKLDLEFNSYITQNVVFG